MNRISKKMCRYGVDRAFYDPEEFRWQREIEANNEAPKVRAAAAGIFALT